ncbi:hypothetical protein HKD37_04G010066 [Glycine soja]
MQMPTLIAHIKSIKGYTTTYRKTWLTKQKINATWLYGKYRGALLVAVAQDDNNKILLIAFVVVKSESVEAWLFFLRNLKRHVTPQHGLCLILDRHKSIKSAYSRCDSGWTTQNSVHMKPMFNYYYNMLREEADVDRAIKWLIEIPREKWNLA